MAKLQEASVPTATARLGLGQTDRQTDRARYRITPPIRRGHNNIISLVIMNYDVAHPGKQQFDNTIFQISFVN